MNSRSADRSIIISVSMLFSHLSVVSFLLFSAGQVDRAGKLRTS